MLDAAAKDRLTSGKALLFETNIPTLFGDPNHTEAREGPRVGSAGKNTCYACMSSAPGTLLGWGMKLLKLCSDLSVCTVVHVHTHTLTRKHARMHETTIIVIINVILKLKNERGRQSILCVLGCTCIHCSETLGNTSFLSLCSDVGRCKKHKHTSPGWALFFLAFLIRHMTLEAHVRQPLRSIFSPRVLSQ